MTHKIVFSSHLIQTPTYVVLMDLVITSQSKLALIAYLEIVFVRIPHALCKRASNYDVYILPIIFSVFHEALEHVKEL